jgi:sensor histidine kinase YesM
MFNQPFRHHIYKILLAATFGWLASLLQEIVISGRWSSWQNFLGEWIFASVYFYVLWFFILFLLKKFPPILKKKSLRLSNLFWGLVLAILGGVLWNLALAISMEIIEKGKWNFTFKASEQLRFIILYYILLIGLTYIVMCGYKILKQFTLMRNTSMRNEKAAMEAQLQMLRSQLNPHFLFNSLNIIASTIKSNPDIAYDFTKNMAAFYRKVLESENVGWVLLKEELKTIRYYLKMLSIRFEDKLVISIQVGEAEQQELLIPEFILQPIVENIIKHNECSRAKPLQIVIAVQADEVLEVKNNIQLKGSKQDGLGIGWFNIESRYKYLGAENPEKYEKDGWFHVKVPLAKAFHTKQEER